MTQEQLVLGEKALAARVTRIINASRSMERGHYYSNFEKGDPTKKKITGLSMTKYLVLWKSINCCLTTSMDLDQEDPQ